MEIIDGLKIGAELIYFLPPGILLILVPTVLAGIFTVLFRKFLPPELFKYLLVAVILFGGYIWAVPMETGFYEFFRSIF